MSITEGQHWSEAVAHLRAGLRHLNALDCAELSPHDVAELELLIGRVLRQRASAEDTPEPKAAP